MRAGLGVAVLSVMMCAAPALAQSSAKPSVNDSAPLATLPVVTVAGHYDNAIGTSDAASQGIVLGEVLQDMPLLRPGEVLETVPGLVVTQHSGDGKANQYSCVATTSTMVPISPAASMACR